MLLVQRIDHCFREAQVRMAQALLPAPQDVDARLLRQCGYEYTAELLYLFCLMNDRMAAPVDLEFDVEPYACDQPDRLARLIEETYIDTQDIPTLNGVREMHDVLDGYERTGDFAPQRWLFVRAAGRDVGVLLLADHPRQNQFELIYMGLIPAARGRGWGAQLARYAQQLTHAAGRERLVLAVDAHNDPAIHAYTTVGFVEWFRRCVFLKVFPALPQI
jgi:ribosomal protein S18 acetylase RimI-like enzyme